VFTLFWATWVSQFFFLAVWVSSLWRSCAAFCGWCALFGDRGLSTPSRIDIWWILAAFIRCVARCWAVSLCLRGGGGGGGGR